MDASEAANLILSGTALLLSASALLIARRQVTLDERSLRLAERESLTAEQERAARSALVVDVTWNPEDGISYATSLNASFSVKITLRNDGPRDATDVTVALLVPDSVRDVMIHGGGRLPRTEQRVFDGEPTHFRRYETMLDRVRSVPHELVGSLQLWTNSGPLSTPVVVEVRCADQPEGQETQAWERSLSWIRQ